MAKIPVCRFEDCPKKDSLDNPLVNIEEYEEAWLMRCSYCGRHRIVTKDKVGGTMGAGRRGDGTVTAMGRGA